MKTSYWIIIGVVVLIVVFIIYKANQTKQQQVADSNINQLSNQMYSGENSQVAQIFSSLYPYFQTGLGFAAGQNNPCPQGYVLDQTTKKCVKTV